MWSARRVLLRYNRDSHRFGSPPLSSSLSFGFVFRNPDGPGSRAARKAWWNRVWSGENRVSRESNCSFHRLFCIRCIRVFFLFLFFFFLVGRGRKVSRDWYFDDNVSVPLNPTRKDSSLLLAEYPLTQEEIASRNFRAFTGSF